MYKLSSILNRTQWKPYTTVITAVHFRMFISLQAVIWKDKRLVSLSFAKIPLDTWTDVEDCELLKLFEKCLSLKLIKFEVTEPHGLEIHLRLTIDFQNWLCLEHCSHDFLKLIR